jgi:hypothetical protein
MSHHLFSIQQKMKILSATTSLLIIFASGISAQENLNPDMAGLTCNKILTMKADSWEQYHYKKTGDGSEQGQDIAYEVYAECHKKRNDAALSKLPQDTAQRIKKYRENYRKFRVASAFLQQAYAGGGTLYAHLARRSAIEDEEMVETLIRLNRQGKPVKQNRNKEIQAKITNLRSQLRQADPAIAKNRQVLSEFSTTDQAKSNYATMKQNFDAIIAMLPKERNDASLLVLKYVDENMQPLVSSVKMQ